MTNSFDDIISNYSSPSPEWQVSINGKSYSNSLELLEFTQSINDPLKFTVKLSGVNSKDNIPQDAEVIISYGGAELVRGVLKEVNPDVYNTYVFKGAGYSTELEGESGQIISGSAQSNPFKDVDVQTVVDTLVDGTALPNTRSFSTSYSGGTATTVVDDFRAKERQLEDVNRLMGEYSIEWYVTFDGSNNPVFNVTDQLFFTTDANDAAGNPKDVLKTYGADQSAEKINQNVNRNKGDFDGVKVYGYGDGDDQITASAGSTGKGNRVLFYTDKTILSQSQAQQRADNLADSNTVAWQEIEVKPSDPNKIYGIGDELKVDAEKARLNDNYRVVEAYYKIHPENNEFESRLNLSNKPQTIVDDFKKQEEQTKSQTDFSQGARNTLNESNKDLAGSNVQGDQEVDIAFNIPQNITESLTGEDNTKQVLLDFVVSDYKKTFKGTTSSVSDSGNITGTTTIDDFGDVDSVNTEANLRTDSNPTTADVTKTDTTNSGGAASSISTDSIDGNISVNAGVVGNIGSATTSSSPPHEKAMYYISLRIAPQRDPVADVSDLQAIAPEIGLNVEQGGIEEAIMRYPIYATAFSPADSTNWVPVNYEVTLKLPKVFDSSTEKVILAADSNTGIQGLRHIERVAEEGHKHQLAESSEAAENVKAYLLDENGNDISASENASYSTSSMSDGGNVNISELDGDDILLSTQNTNASTLTVKLNGTEIAGSPYDLSSISASPPYKKAGIELPLNQLNTPGQNTVTLVTDDTALVKGNVIVDHKVEGERQ